MNEVEVDPLTDLRPHRGVRRWRRRLPQEAKGVPGAVGDLGRIPLSGFEVYLELVVLGGPVLLIVVDLQRPPEPHSCVGGERPRRFGQNGPAGRVGECHGAVGAVDRHAELRGRKRHGAGGRPERPPRRRRRTDGRRSGPARVQRRGGASIAGSHDDHVVRAEITRSGERDPDDRVRLDLHREKSVLRLKTDAVGQSFGVHLHDGCTAGSGLLDRWLAEPHCGTCEF